VLTGRFADSAVLPAPSRFGFAGTGGVEHVVPAGSPAAAVAAVCEELPAADLAFVVAAFECEWAARPAELVACALRRLRRGGALFALLPPPAAGPGLLGAAPGAALDLLGATCAELQVWRGASGALVVAASGYARIRAPLWPAVDAALRAGRLPLATPPPVGLVARGAARLALPPPPLPPRMRVIGVPVRCQRYDRLDTAALAASMGNPGALLRRERHARAAARAEKFR
jgi:hypothetical protein